jgi:hypothetical protein
MKFDFNKYKGKYAMHCKTIGETDDFYDIMNRNKMTWSDGDTYNKNDKYFWDQYKEDTCFSFNEGMFCRMDYYKKEGYTILEWSNFMDKGEGKMNTCMDEMKYLVGLHKNTMTKRNNTALPKDVDSVIFNWNNTVVTLTDGRKGVSKCEECDEFDPYTGYTIAYYKAKHDKNFELKRMFNGCIEYSKKKGYKQTIIKSK